MNCNTIALCLNSRQHNLCAWPMHLIYCMTSATTQPCYLKEVTKCASHSVLYDVEMPKETCHRNLQASTHTVTVRENASCSVVSGEHSKATQCMENASYLNVHIETTVLLQQVEKELFSLCK